jgi:hypothetical protein
VKACPRCGKHHPLDATTCECGHQFRTRFPDAANRTQMVQTPDVTDESVTLQTPALKADPTPATVAAPRAAVNGRTWLMVGGVSAVTAFCTVIAMVILVIWGIVHLISGAFQRVDQAQQQAASERAATLAAQTARDQRAHDDFIRGYRSVQGQPEQSDPQPPPEPLPQQETEIIVEPQPPGHEGGFVRHVVTHAPAARAIPVPPVMMQPEGQPAAPQPAPVQPRTMGGYGGGGFGNGGSGARL